MSTRRRLPQPLHLGRPRFAIGEREVLIVVTTNRPRVVRALYNRRTGRAVLVDAPPTDAVQTTYGQQEFTAGREHTLSAELEGITWVRGWNDAAARAFEVAIALRGSM